jgi:thiol:disulfide interchange protein/DsbC/DsbD-like thiol-disulfide interchange protein
MADRCASSLLRSAPILALILACAAPVRAQLPVGDRPPVSASLIAGQDNLEAGRPLWIALRLDIEEGWHVYWRNPGESGLPTQLELELPPGFSSGDVVFPAPRLYETGGVVSYGLEGRPLILVRITPPDSSPSVSPLLIRGRASWLACKEECVPGQAKLSLELGPPGAAVAPDAEAASAIREALEEIPERADEGTLSARVESGKVKLELGYPTEAKVGSARFFAFESGLLPSAEARILSAADGSIRLDLGSLAKGDAEKGDTGRQLPDRLRGYLALDSGGATRWLELDAPLTRAGPVSAQGGIGLALALILAFLGGIVLNLMPCVLPVLSLKIAHLVRQVPGGSRGSLLHGLAYGAGILVSFLALAALLIVLRAGGGAVGWGFQFQDPGVVAALASLFFLISLNLFGVFEIGASLAGAAGNAELALRGAGGPGIPEPAASRSVGARAEGGGAPKPGALLLSFAGGLFATLAATPCTAPFMGAALGWALAQSAPAALSVFAALGLGMALPFVLLSARPGLVKLLPKPGRWTESLRAAMGFPMMGAAIWMLHILGLLSGSGAIARSLAALLVCGLGAWLWGRWGGMDGGRRRRLTARIAAALLVVLGLGYAIASAGRSAVKAERGGSGRPEGGSTWEPWSAARVAQLRAEGRPVFVDFSAEWCLSCKLNEAAVLGREAVLSRFREGGVALLKADWTARDEAIAAELASHGRAGVPLYLLYGSGSPEPLVLPEILTARVLRETLEEAGVPLSD